MNCVRCGDQLDEDGLHVTLKDESGMGLAVDDCDGNGKAIEWCDVCEITHAVEPRPCEA